ncbi:MAG: sodium:solute symporter family protein [Candidatus Amoebophilus sp.]
MISSTTSLWHTLTLWDWSMFLLTVLLTLLASVYGVYIQKRYFVNHKEDTRNSWTEYILMGRRLTLPLFVATLVATWYGDILGVTQIAFQYGIYTFLTQGVFWYISYILFAILLARYIRRMQILSFPELFSRLVGNGPGKFSATLIFLKTLPVTYAIGVGIFLKTLFPISFPVAVSIGLIFVFIYSLFGGFRAIVFSDFVQVICMYLGVISVVIISFLKFGGINYLVLHCPPSHFTFCSNFSVLDTFVWFFIAISTTFLNPTFYQRCLSAQTDRVAIRGILVSIFCWIVFDICTTLIGLYAKAYCPSVEPLNASLYYCLHILPHGLKGLFLGAVLATILSTLDSFMFISSTTLMYDLKLMQYKSKFLSHLVASSITGIFTFCIVIFYKGNFEMAWRLLKGVFAACIFPPFILSYFKPHCISIGLFTGSCLGVLVGILIWNVTKPLPIDAFYIGQGISWLILGIGILKKHL